MRLLGGLFGGKEGTRPTETLTTKFAYEKVKNVAKVGAVIEEYVEFRDQVIRGGNSFNDTDLLKERLEAIRKALKENGVVLQFVPGKYVQSEDESVEAFVAFYQEQQAALAEAEGQDRAAA